MNTTHTTLTTATLDQAYCGLLDKGWDPSSAHAAVFGNVLSLEQLFGDEVVDGEVSLEDFIDTSDSHL